ncbi:MAG: PKD domain-containing protein [Alphaproteobacteria bacterium]
MATTARDASVVRFDAGGSHDPDGTILRYDWDFGDGRSGSGCHAGACRPRPGTYQRVHLTVTDDSGTLRNTASDAHPT